VIKKIIISFLILSFGNFSKAQNLVLNGNFEIYSQCPTATSSQSNMQINYATGWTQSTPVSVGTNVPITSMEISANDNWTSV